MIEEQIKKVEEKLENLRQISKKSILRRKSIKNRFSQKQN